MNTKENDLPLDLPDDIKDIVQWLLKIKDKSTLTDIGDAVKASLPKSFSETFLFLITEHKPKEACTLLFNDKTFNETDEEIITKALQLCISLGYTNVISAFLCCHPKSISNNIIEAAVETALEHKQDDVLVSLITFVSGVRACGNSLNPIDEMACGVVVKYLTESNDVSRGVGNAIRSLNKRKRNGDSGIKSISGGVVPFVNNPKNIIKINALGEFMELFYDIDTSRKTKMRTAKIFAHLETYCKENSNAYYLKVMKQYYAVEPNDHFLTIVKSVVSLGRCIKYVPFAKRAAAPNMKDFFLTPKTQIKNVLEDNVTTDINTTDDDTSIGDSRHSMSRQDAIQNLKQQRAPEMGFSSYTGNETDESSSSSGESPLHPSTFFDNECDVD